MRVSVFCLVCSLLTIFLFPATVVPLPDVFNPDSIVVTDNEIYITAFPTIYIYSPRDFRLKKKFGRRGEGPREFRRLALVSVRPGYLLVGDRNKVLYFTREGKYLREINAGSIINWGAVPLGDGFAARSRLLEGNIQFDTLNIYDAGLNKVKEAARYKFFYQTLGGGRKCRAVEVRGIQFQVYDDKIFFKTGQDLVIDVFDQWGEKICTIRHDYRRIKLSGTVKKRFEDYFKTTEPWKRRYDVQIKKEIAFPEYLPAIQTFIAADKKLYVFTYETKAGKSKFVILDIGGKGAREVFLPFDQSEQWFHYSLAKTVRYGSQNPTFSIKNGKIYQLVENEEEEHWELHVSPID